MDIVIIKLDNAYEVDGIKFFSPSTSRSAFDMYTHLRSIRTQDIKTVTVIDGKGTTTKTVSEFLT